MFTKVLKYNDEIVVIETYLSNMELTEKVRKLLDEGLSLFEAVKELENQGYCSVYDFFDIELISLDGL